jgi:hypothetical protein
MKPDLENLPIRKGKILMDCALDVCVSASCLNKFR